jgi:hypothetical protein
MKGHSAADVVACARNHRREGDMATHARGRFTGVPIALDGNTYTDCLFTNSVISHIAGVLFRAMARSW